MGKVIFSLGCDLTYDPKEGIELRIKQGENYSHKAMRPLLRAGEQMLIGLRAIVKPIPAISPKIREKIEIEEE
jgi:hypothetical protein